MVNRGKEAQTITLNWTDAGLSADKSVSIRDLWQHKDLGTFAGSFAAPVRGYRRLGLRNLFVVCQMAASLMLLLVTWYVVRLFLSDSRLDPGFETANLNLMSLDPVRDGYSPADAAALFGALPDELSRVTGVRSVSFTGSVPFASLSNADPNTQMSAPAREEQAPQAQHSVFRSLIGANYLATVGVPLVGGREFDRRDLQPADPVPAIVNRTAARELFGSADPIGRRIREGQRNYRVVGLRRDVRSGFLQTRPVATVFLPLTTDRFRTSPAERITVLVRGTKGPDTLAAVRNQLASLHPDLMIFNVRTMREDVERLNSFVEWNAAIYEVLGLFALLLACIGLGGVTAYAVARRRKEIGIRMALGARARQVQGLVLKEGTILVAAGTVLGLGGSFFTLRALSAYTPIMMNKLGEVPHDLLVLFVAPLVLVGFAMVSCALPARRARRSIR